MGYRNFKIIRAFGRRRGRKKALPCPEGMKKEISLIIRNVIHYCLAVFNYMIRYKIWKRGETPGRITK